MMFTFLLFVRHSLVLGREARSSIPIHSSGISLSIQKAKDRGVPSSTDAKSLKLGRFIIMHGAN
jgi:hypothetical protein